MHEFAGTGSSNLPTQVLHVSSLVLEKQAITLVWGHELHLVPRTASKNVAHCLMRKECASFHDQDREGVHCSLCLEMNGVSGRLLLPTVFPYSHLHHLPLANNMIGQLWSTEVLIVLQQVIVEQVEWGWPRMRLARLVQTTHLRLVVLTNAMLGISVGLGIRALWMWGVENKGKMIKTVIWTVISDKTSITDNTGMATVARIIDPGHGTCNPLL
ncbi:hypothetical protein BDR04DRAFT_1114528 [Suillus decipiens]|nr:hypothetical protein BDR04DRAFT_1114528 [Suillus decipiens]